MWRESAGPRAVEEPRHVWKLGDPAFRPGWSEYGEKLAENLKGRSGKLREGRYRATAVRRHSIEKSDGRMLPVGIPTLGDQILQRATTEVLNAVYEVEFKGYSYGFRPGRSQHKALDAISIALMKKRQARGDVIIVRDADDFVMGFQHKAEAEQLQTELRERFTKFNLSLHPEKTRLIEFGRKAAADIKRRGEGKPETFGFLGFTHICEVTLARGKFIVLRQTIRKRMGAKLKEIKELKERLRDRMHEPIAQTGRWLRAVVSGEYRYHAVPRNLPAMTSFHRRVGQLWQATLNRRSHKADTGWKRMDKMINRWLPSPKVMHPYPEQRFGVIT